MLIAPLGMKPHVKFPFVTATAGVCVDTKR